MWFEDAGRRNLERGGRPEKEKWIAIGQTLERSSFWGRAAGGSCYLFTPGGL